MNEPELSDELLEQALFQHNLAIASELTAADSEPRTEAELRRRFHREGRARRLGLRIPSRALKEASSARSREPAIRDEAPIFSALPNHGLTPPRPEVALPEHVRNLLDWLVDEELKRWQHEEQ